MGSLCYHKRVDYTFRHVGGFSTRRLRLVLGGGIFLLLELCLCADQLTQAIAYGGLEAGESQNQKTKQPVNGCF